MCHAVLLWVFLATAVLAISQFDESVVAERGEIRRIVATCVDSTSISRTLDLILITDLNDSAFVRVRVPTNREGRSPVAVLTVGVETGRRVVGMIRGFDSVVVAAIDYPFRGDFDFSGWNVVGTSLRLRDAFKGAIPHISLAIDWLSAQAFVDTNDISIISVSLGVFSAVPAAVFDSRVDRLVVIQGGGDVGEIISANTERLDLAAPSWLMSWLGEMFFSELEPVRTIGRLSPRPLLVVSGESDELFPEESAKALYDSAEQPKEWIRHTSGHVAPDAHELILQLTDLVGKRLYGNN